MKRISGSKRVLSLAISVLLCIAVLWPSGEIWAQDENQPLTTLGPTDSTANLQPNIDNNHRIYNDHVVPDLPAQSRKADISDDGNVQEDPGRGVRQNPAGEGEGLNLYRSSVVCNDFNQSGLWASQAKSGSDLRRDSYAGWGIFAANDGDFYKAQNVIISFERSVGPGNKYGPNQFSAKITSNQPYAAGFGSPLFSVLPGSEVTVSVKYLIFDHDVQGQDYDWVSLGIKPDATGDVAEYVNSYVRGQWAELSHSVTAGETGQIMVLIQAHAPVAVNSNIYFDDVSIIVDGVPREECIFEG